MWLAQVAICVVIVVAAAGCRAAGGAAGYNVNEIYCCGDRVVFVINAAGARNGGVAARVWTWTPIDSPQIAPAHRGWFRGMDECKPVLGGSAVLVASSNAGAVALVRRADKKCLFYAGGRNAHSAELIGEDLLVGAFSYKCDELRLYRLDREPLAATPAWRMPLVGAHGVVWDRLRQVLWALGESELLKLSVSGGEEPSAKVLKRWRLPAGGGHDLFGLDEGHLTVTVNEGVYRFDVVTATFSAMKELADVADVKSVCRNPATGQIIYTRGGPEGWWTRMVRFVGGGQIDVGPMKMYKARWNARNDFSYER